MLLLDIDGIKLAAEVIDLTVKKILCAIVKVIDGSLKKSKFF